MRKFSILSLFIVIAVFLIFDRAVASGLPVVSTHPRIWLTPAIKSGLDARKNANDPRWLELKAKADLLKTYPILPYSPENRTYYTSDTIIYDYQGEGWWDATAPLALAYVMTKDVAYSNKLFQLVDEMIRAQSDPADTAFGYAPLQAANYYPTRNL
ncbi:MAG: hypothetical protein ABI778_12980, partial [Ignavibacteriota bacterium]